MANLIFGKNIKKKTQPHTVLLTSLLLQSTALHKLFLNLEFLMSFFFFLFPFFPVILLSSFPIYMLLSFLICDFCLLILSNWRFRTPSSCSSFYFWWEVVMWVYVVAGGGGGVFVFFIEEVMCRRKHFFLVKRSSGGKILMRAGRKKMLMEKCTCCWTKFPGCTLSPGYLSKRCAVKAKFRFSFTFFWRLAKLREKSAELKRMSSKDFCFLFPVVGKTPEKKCGIWKDRIFLSLFLAVTIILKKKRVKTVEFTSKMSLGMTKVVHPALRA